MDFVCAPAVCRGGLWKTIDHPHTPSQLVPYVVHSPSYIWVGLDELLYLPLSVDNGCVVLLAEGVPDPL